MKICLLATVLLLQMPSPAQMPPRHGLVLAEDSVPYPSPVGMGKMHWSGDHLAGCDHCVGSGPVVWAVDREGLRKSAALAVPGVARMVVRDVAAGPDGRMAAVGYAIDNHEQRISFIVWMSAEGDSQILQAWPYQPEVITVAPDGTVWTLGEMLNDDHMIVHPNVLQHYSQSGQLLASTVVKRVKKSPGGLYATGVYNVSGNSTLTMSKDRIGWFTSTGQYIEFSLEGVQLDSYNAPDGIDNIIDIAGVALSSSGDVLVQPKWLTPLAPLQLDRATGAWKPVPVLKDVGITHMMLGFDGLTLVTSVATSQGAFMRRYSWSDAAPVIGRGGQ